MTQFQHSRWLPVVLITAGCGIKVVGLDEPAAEGDGGSGGMGSVSNGTGGSAASGGYNGSGGSSMECPPSADGWESEVLPIMGIAPFEITAVNGIVGVFAAGGSDPVVRFAWRDSQGVWQDDSYPSDYWQHFGVTVDDGGTFHLVYNDGVVRYLHSPFDGSPVVEVGPSTSCDISSASIDDSGVLHVAGTEGKDQLCVGHRDLLGTWTFETPSQKAFPRGTTILAESGVLHVASYGPRLKYSRKVGTSPWETADVDIGGIDQNMALGPGGQLHIGHSESPTGSVLVTTGSFGAWNLDVVRSSGQSHTAAPGLAIDAGGDTHLVYPSAELSASSPGTLRYARASTGWQDEEVSSQTYDLANIAIDAAGVRHVAYTSGNLLCHAFKP